LYDAYLFRRHARRRQHSRSIRAAYRTGNEKSAMPKCSSRTPGASRSSPTSIIVACWLVDARASRVGRAPAVQCIDRSEPIYIARALGHLNPNAVPSVEYPSASEVLCAFRNEAIDGMVISPDELFGQAIDGLRPRVILATDISPGGGRGRRKPNGRDLPSRAPRRTSSAGKGRLASGVERRSWSTSTWRQMNCPHAKQRCHLAHGQSLLDHFVKQPLLAHYPRRAHVCAGPVRIVVSHLLLFSKREV